MTRQAAEQVIVSKVDRCWADRALDMFREMTTGTAVTTISNLRVAKDWPARGSITFTRDRDGKRCRLYATRAAFRATAK